MTVCSDVRRVRVVAAVAALVGAASCGTTSQGPTSVPSARPTPPAPAAVVRLASLHHGMQAWQRPLAVTVRRGTLARVVVTGPAGVVRGRRTATRWLSRAPLWPASRYVVHVTTRRADGRRDTTVLRMRTTDAPRLHTVLTPGDGDVAGVGIPVVVYFGSPVPESLQATVARRVVVTAHPRVRGEWQWLTSTELHWRPMHYWAAHSRVTVSMDLTGIRFGSALWGEPLRTTTWRVGDAHLSTVDIDTHMMRVTSNGKLLRVIAISAGRPKYPTHGGIHITLEKAPDIIMDSATVGIPRDSPDGYYEEVFWNVRIANSGEFVHSAPWSVYAQGVENVSHGCVNAGPDNARWFYDFSLRGDIVRVLGGAPPSLWDQGTFDWNAPASTWHR